MARAEASDSSTLSATRVDSGDEALEHMLYEQMSHPKALGSVVKHYLRTPSDRAYRFLMSSVDRFVELGRVDRNRKF